MSRSTQLLFGGRSLLSGVLLYLTLTVLGYFNVGSRSALYADEKLEITLDPSYIYVKRSSQVQFYPSEGSVVEKLGTNTCHQIFGEYNIPWFVLLDSETTYHLMDIATRWMNSPLFIRLTVKAARRTVRFPGRVEGSYSKLKTPLETFMFLHNYKDFKFTEINRSKADFIEDLFFHLDQYLSVPSSNFRAKQFLMKYLQINQVVELDDILEEWSLLKIDINKKFGDGAFGNVVRTFFWNFFHQFSYDLEQVEREVLNKNDLFTDKDITELHTFEELERDYREMFRQPRWKIPEMAKNYYQTLVTQASQLEPNGDAQEQSSSQKKPVGPHKDEVLAIKLSQSWFPSRRKRAADLLVRLIQQNQNLDDTQFTRALMQLSLDANDTVRIYTINLINFHLSIHEDIVLLAELESLLGWKWRKMIQENLKNAKHNERLSLPLILMDNERNNRRAVAYLLSQKYLELQGSAQENSTLRRAIIKILFHKDILPNLGPQQDLSPLRIFLERPGVLRSVLQSKEFFDDFISKDFKTQEKIIATVWATAIAKDDPKILWVIFQTEWFRNILKEQDKWPDLVFSMFYESIEIGDDLSLAKNFFRGDNFNFFSTFKTFSSSNHEAALIALLNHKDFKLRWERGEFKNKFNPPEDRTYLSNLWRNVVQKVSNKNNSSTFLIYLMENRTMQPLLIEWANENADQFILPLLNASLPTEFWEALLLSPWFDFGKIGANLSEGLLRRLAFVVSETVIERFHILKMAKDAEIKQKQKRELEEKQKAKDLEREWFYLHWGPPEG